MQRRLWRERGGALTAGVHRALQGLKNKSLWSPSSRFQRESPGHPWHPDWEGHLCPLPKGPVHQLCLEPALLYPGLWHQCPHWPQAWVLSWGPPSNLLPLLGSAGARLSQAPPL